MPIPQLTVCPSTLAEGFSRYSPAALKHLFGGEMVSHILPVPPPSENTTEAKKAVAGNVGRLSLSGAQPKLGMVTDGGVLHLIQKRKNLLRGHSYRMISNTSTVDCSLTASRCCGLINRIWEICNETCNLKALMRCFSDYI